MRLSKGGGVGWPFMILFLSVCYPFTFGQIGNLPDLKFIEWMAPLALFIGINRVLRRRQSLMPHGARNVIIATMLLLAASCAHFIFHPVSSEHLLGAGAGSGGIRAYYTIFIGFCVLMYSTWFSRYWVKYDMSWENLLWYVVWISLLIGYARLLTYFINVQIPFLTEHYLYSGKGGRLLGEAHRIGGLSFASGMGLSALAGIYYQRRWSVGLVVLALAFLFLAIMSGGRAYVVGVFFAFFVYLVLIRKEFGRATILFAIALAVISLSSQYALFAKQFGRITQYEGGIEEQASGRYVAARYEWSIFLDNLLIGKGIGWQHIPKDAPKGLSNILTSGGHGSYGSMLGLFGLIGVYFLASLLFGTLLRSLHYLRRYASRPWFSTDNKMILSYIVFQLSIMSVTFFVEGNGFDYLRLYTYAGIGSGIISKMRYAK